MTPEEKLMNCKHLFNCQECADEVRVGKNKEEEIESGWYWACAEYTDDGWFGPFETRELAEADARSASPAEFDDEPADFAFQEFGSLATLRAENAAYIWLHSQSDWHVNLYSAGGWLLFDCRRGSGRYADRIDCSETQMAWPTPLEAITKAREMARQGEG